MNRRGLGRGCGRSLVATFLGISILGGCASSGGGSYPDRLPAEAQTSAADPTADRDQLMSQTCYELRHAQSCNEAIRSYTACVSSDIPVDKGLKSVSATCRKRLRAVSAKMFGGRKP